MIIRISNVRSDLDAVILRLRQEIRTPGRPLAIGGTDVSHADIHEGARAIRIGRSRQGYARLVISWSASDVDDDPTVGHFQNDWIPLADNLSIEHRLVELA